MARETDQPPIVHAAGVIPPEVEQAVTAQIQQRAWQAATGWSTTERPEPIKVTRQEWEALKARFPESAPNPLTTGAIGAPLYGIPVEIVEPDPTPEPGWLKRRLRRWFG